MPLRSFTSSFERLPWGGLLAAALVVLLDVSFFSPSGPWQWLYDRIPVERRLYEGRVIQQEIALDRLGNLPPAGRAIYIGSSRALHGFDPKLAPLPERPPLVFANLSALMLSPVSMRALAEGMVTSRPRLVIVFLSEWDTHFPVWIDPQTPYGNLSTAAELARLAGPGFAFEHRSELYRLSLTGFLRSYGYRSVLRAAGLDRLRRFELPGKIETRRSEWTHPWFSPVISGDPPMVGEAVIERLAASLGERFGNPLGARLELDEVAFTTRGPHVAVQMGLLRSTIRMLRDAGADVLVVEAPLHPEAAEVYDASLRKEFLAFVTALVEIDGVRFLPLEAGDPFVHADFLDVTHLNPRGARKLTRATLAAVREMLRDEKSRRAPRRQG